MPTITDLSDLSDGVGFACIASLYFPEELSWRNVVARDVSSRGDAMHHIQLFQRVLATASISNICHFLPEDIAYLQGAMKQNFIAFLADLFWTLEVRQIRPQDGSSQPTTLGMHTYFFIPKLYEYWSCRQEAVLV